MALFNRLLIGIDFTNTDKHILKHAAALCRFNQPEKVYFIHVNDNLDLPEEVRKELYGDVEPYDEYLRKEMEKTVEKSFPEHEQLACEFMVVEGSLLPQMLHWAKIKEVDLAVLGRKTSKGSGIFLTRFTRRASCSVLIVPESYSEDIDSILVCNDFSINSELSMQKALEFASTNPNTTIYSQNIYTVPVGYHKTGKSFDDFARIMKKHAINRYQEFCKRMSFDENVMVTPIFSLDKHSDTASLVKNTAESLQAKLIIIGSKGRTFAASIFLGSFAERMINKQTEVPLLVVKRKDETLGIMEAIKNL